MVIMNKMFLILVFTMLSILAISPIVSADQTNNNLWALSNGNAVASDSDVYNSGYYPLNTEIDNIFKIIFYLLISVIMPFTSIMSIRFFLHCKRV